MSAEFESVDGYIASFPTEVRPILESVRQTILAAAPGLDETIPNDVPTYTYVRKRSCILPAGNYSRASIASRTATKIFQQRVASYRSGMSTLRLSFALPIPPDLVTSVVTHLIAKRFKKASSTGRPFRVSDDCAPVD